MNVKKLWRQQAEEDIKERKVKQWEKQVEDG